MYKSGESAVNIMPNDAASPSTTDKTLTQALLTGATSAGSSVLDRASFFDSGIVTTPKPTPYIRDTIILNIIVTVPSHIAGFCLKTRYKTPVYKQIITISFDNYNIILLNAPIFVNL